MRILLVDETPERAEGLRAALARAGHEVMAQLPDTLALLSQIETLQPDLIIVDTDSPGRDMLEHLCAVTERTPRPVVMFTFDGSHERIREAIHAGVSAYVVGRPDQREVAPLIEEAVVRFQHFQALRQQLQEARSRLAERKVIERAKGLLMKHRGMAEEEAYHALRRLAMARNQRIAEVARRVLDMAELIG